ncbi:succinyl-CoA:3-ketoacid-coenzyme A transferas-like protein [Aureobasidium pullulans]|uniref:Succinyl-CoA:3-ketoacid-coenzyme A transferase n=1 Tax=Aureobasidium pullulans TaxID=5580 RepID=A0A4S9DZH9_AURPU|nr:succinyl-CoA:3-ketoacid-coenzyme A transferas-like protein [Aureobasidium pullulans]THY40425.1 succinyl-CoA:3-ketoacid-coenzyme A transferas-like protein [Aureobasidium pullulans]THY41683.1 succinyl-CoA:3-ketoacid-coenzyme A transferas-like protein [Aureobasidium pullulans]
MAATRRSCTRLSALLPSSSNALLRTQLPRVSARVALSRRTAGVAGLTFTRGFINDVKTGGSNASSGVEDIGLNESLAPTIDRSRSKVYASADEAVADIKSGSTILSAGFGLCGTADTIIKAMAKRGVESLHSLKAVSNNAGAGPYGLAELVQNGQLTSVILSFLGTNKAIEKKYLSGELDVELTPQGTIAERIRAGGAGIPAFYTPTGVHTWIETGEIPIRMGPPKEGSKMPTTLQPGNRRETREFKGKKFNLEHAIQGDVAILRAYKVDEAGNCVFRYTTGNFGPMMAKAAACSIVEAEHIVPIGEIKPDEVDLPGIYIDRIVPATEEKKLEVKKLREVEGGDQSNKSEGEKRRERIARRAAKELKQGYYVNLGVGMPTLAPSFLDPKIKVWIHSENGLMGMGPYPTEEEVDVDIINAGKETVTILPGGSTFDSAESFAMIRGGHIDVSMLGALQVSANGDLANYMIPGKVLKGMGGAMDLVSNPDQTKIVVLTDHVDKNGVSKIQQECSLPLTGARCVSTIITELCVFQVDRKNGGLTLTEVAPGVTVEQVQEKTAAKFKVADDLHEME